MGTVSLKHPTSIAFVLSTPFLYLLDPYASASLWMVDILRAMSTYDQSSYFTAEIAALKSAGTVQGRASAWS
jgi:hypothetical protein